MVNPRHLAAKHGFLSFALLGPVLCSVLECDPGSCPEDLCHQLLQVQIQVEDVGRNTFQNLSLPQHLAETFSAVHEYRCGRVSSSLSLINGMTQDENVPATSNVSTNLPAKTQNLPATTTLAYMGANMKILVFTVVISLLSIGLGLSDFFTPTEGYDQFCEYSVRIQNVGGLINIMSNTISVPPSYKIATLLGQGVAASGLLMSLYYVGAGIGIFVAQYITGFSFLPERYFRENMIFSCLIQTVALWAQGFLMSPACYGVNGELRWYLLLFMCFVRGLGCAVNIYDGKTITARMIPKRELMLFATNQTVYQAIGIGLGPLGFSCYCVAFGVVGSNLELTVPLYAQAGLQMVIAALYANIAPKSQKEVAERIEQKVIADIEDKEKEKREGRAAADGVPYDEMDEELRHAAQHVWIGGICFSMEKGASVAALEVASALLLESTYGVSTANCGFIVSLSFLVCTPFLMVINQLRDAGMISERTLLLTLCALGPSGSLLLSTQAAAALGFAGKPYTLITADCLIFPSTYYTNGIFDGFALKFADKNQESLYTQQKYISWAFIAISATRGIAPTLARGLIAMGGQNMYALFQCVCCSFSFCGALHVRHQLDKLGVK